MADVTARILLVEDHFDSADCLARLLQSSGYEVVIAASGQEALQIARERGFDVALCDIGLPDIDGCELLGKLLSLQPMKGIAVTGHGMNADVERFRDAGFSAHLLKPYAFDDVIAAIRSAMSEPKTSDRSR